MATGVSRKPVVVFVCVSNAEKSQIAEAIMNLKSANQVDASSAGTEPRDQINELSQKVVAEIGADMSGGVPKPIDFGLLSRADRVIVLSAAAVFDESGIKPGRLERWGIDEPSERGIDGVERMRLIRDDIELHVNQLITDLHQESELTS